MSAEAIALSPAFARANPASGLHLVLPGISAQPAWILSGGVRLCRVIRGAERLAWLHLIRPRLTGLAFLSTLIRVQQRFVPARPEISSWLPRRASAAVLHGILSRSCALAHGVGHLLIHELSLLLHLRRSRHSRLLRLFEIRYGNIAACLPALLVDARLLALRVLTGFLHFGLFPFLCVLHRVLGLIRCIVDHRHQLCSFRWHFRRSVRCGVHCFSLLPAP